jgi:hypothetical protein
MCFHFENQSIHVNLIVSLVLAKRNGKSYIGVFKASNKAEAELRLLCVFTKYRGVSKKLSLFLPSSWRYGIFESEINGCFKPKSAKVELWT